MCAAFVNIKISVIIPFFKVAPFVERCTRSLMEQTLEDVEFIFVDDKSPDESAEIIRRVVSEYNRNVKILKHTENKGLPAARNTGLAEAKGDFVFHCDSDDYLEPTMLEDMYKASVEDEADYIYCDYYIDFGTSRRYMGNPSFSEPEKMVKEGFLAGMMKYNVWNKLVKRSLYSSGDDILFPSGHSMGEDMTMIMLALKATKVGYVQKALYHYMKTNSNAFTSTFSERHLSDTLFNTSRTLESLRASGFKEDDKFLSFFKLNVKLPFLMTRSFSQYKLWQKWFPDANRYIWQNKLQPFRTRLVQIFAKWRLFPLVWLYSFAVEKFYYGLKLLKR